MVMPFIVGLMVKVVVARLLVVNVHCVLGRPMQQPHPTTPNHTEPHPTTPNHNSRNNRKKKQKTATTATAT
jgi:hypothetical protein